MFLLKYSPLESAPSHASYFLSGTLQNEYSWPFRITDISCNSWSYLTLPTNDDVCVNALYLCSFITSCHSLADSLNSNCFIFFFFFFMSACDQSPPRSTDSGFFLTRYNTYKDISLSYHLLLSLVFLYLH